MKLSHREHDVLTLVACGNTDKEVAYKLKISKRTVDSHMTSIVQKLNAKNRVNAVVIYMKLNPKWNITERNIV